METLEAQLADPMNAGRIRQASAGRRASAMPNLASQGHSATNLALGKGRRLSGAGGTSAVGAAAAAGGMSSILDLFGLGGAKAAAPAAAGGAAPPNAKLRAAAKGAAPQQQMPLPHDALPNLLKAVEQITAHFAQADAPGATQDLATLGDDQRCKQIAVLVRGQLCTALSRVLLHGFKSFKLIGRWHIWDFVQQSCDATAARKAGGGKLSDAEKSLTAAVEEVNSHEGMQNNPNIKFRSFVCCGLNHRHLGEWVRVLTDDSETMGKFYESWAFVLKKEVGAVRHATRTPPPRAVATTHRSAHSPPPAPPPSTAQADDRLSPAARRLRLRALARLRAHEVGLVSG